MTSTYQWKDVKAKPDKPRRVDQKLGLKRKAYSERSECPSSTLHNRASWGVFLGQQHSIGRRGHR